MAVFNPATVNPQRFSLPRSMAYYIASNPKNPDFYLKMMDCCKYFYASNKLLIVFDPRRESDDRWTLAINTTYYNTIKTSIDHKIWIADEISGLDYHNPSATSLFLQSAAFCDIRHLVLCGQRITWKEYLLLTSSGNIDLCTVENSYIKSDEFESVPLEKLLEELPNIFRFEYVRADDDFSGIGSETAANFVKLPHLSKLTKFYVRNIPESFDLKTFVEFANANYLNTTINLSFKDSLMNEDKQRIRGIKAALPKRSPPIRIEF